MLFSRSNKIQALMIIAGGILLSPVSELQAAFTWTNLQPDTGYYTQDVIYELDQAGLVNAQFGARNFYAESARPTGRSVGLRDDRTYSYNFGGAIGTGTFTLQPYNASNVRITNGTASQTATFSGAGQQNLSYLGIVLAGTSQGNVLFNYTINYVGGGGATTGTLDVKNWVTGTTGNLGTQPSSTAELFNVGRTWGTPTVPEGTPAGTNTGADSGNAIWSLFAFAIETDSTRAIQSITYNLVAGTDYTPPVGTVVTPNLGVFAFSGAQAIPEPSKAFLLLAGLAACNLRRNRRKLV